MLCVLNGDLVLKGGRDEDVAGLFERFSRVGEDLSRGIVGDAATLTPIVRDLLHVEAIGVVDTGINLGDADDASAVLGEFASSVVSHVAESLHDHTLVVQAR